MAHAASLILLSMIKNRVRHLKIMAQGDPCVLTSRFQMAQARALKNLTGGFSEILDFDAVPGGVFLLRFTPLREQHEAMFWKDAEKDMIKLRSVLAKIAKKDKVTPQITAEMIARQDFSMVAEIYALLDYTILVIKTARIMKQREQTFVFANSKDLFGGDVLIMSELRRLRSERPDLLEAAIRNQHVKVENEDVMWTPSVGVTISNEMILRSINPTSMDQRGGKTVDILKAQMIDLRVPICVDRDHLVEINTIAQNHLVEMLVDNEVVARFTPDEYVQGCIFSERYMGEIFERSKVKLNGHQMRQMILRLEAVFAAIFRTFTQVGNVAIVGHRLATHKDQDFLAAFVARLAEKVATAREMLDRDQLAQTRITGKIAEKNSFWTEGAELSPFDMSAVPRFSARRDLFLQTF